MRIALAQWKNGRLEIEGSLVRASLESLFCVFCLVLVQARMAEKHPNMTEKNVDQDVKHQHK